MESFPEGAIYYNPDHPAAKERGIKQEQYWVLLPHLLGVIEELEGERPKGTYKYISSDAEVSEREYSPRNCTPPYIGGPFDHWGGHPSFDQKRRLLGDDWNRIRGSFHGSSSAGSSSIDYQASWDLKRQAPARKVEIYVDAFMPWYQLGRGSLRSDSLAVARLLAEC